MEGVLYDLVETPKQLCNFLSSSGRWGDNCIVILLPERFFANLKVSDFCNDLCIYILQDLSPDKVGKEKRPLHRQVAMSVSTNSSGSMETHSPSLEAHDDIVLRRSSNYPQGSLLSSPSTLSGCGKNLLNRKSSEWGSVKGSFYLFWHFCW